MEFDQLYGNRMLKTYDERTVTKMFYEFQIDKFDMFLKMLKDTTDIDENDLNEIENPRKDQIKIFSGNSSGLERKYGVYASMMRPGVRIWE